MKLVELHSAEIDVLIEGLFDIIPPGLRKPLTGVIAAAMLASGHAQASDENLLRSKAKETAALVADMNPSEYKSWISLVKTLGKQFDPEEFEERVGVDFKWLIRRLDDSTPTEMAKTLARADQRLVRHHARGPENVKRKLWLRPIEERKAEYAIKYFVDQGLPKLSAIALVGGFIQESRLNEKAVNKDSGAFGIAQWLHSRKEDVPQTFQGQLDYVMHELQTTEKRAMQMLMQAKDLGSAIKGAARYERFNRRGEWGERIGYTDLLYDMHHDEDAG